MHAIKLSTSWCAEVGLQTFVDLLEFIGSLILSEGEGIHLGLDIFGLSLLQAALNTGAQALARCAATPVHAASGVFLGNLPAFSSPCRT